MINFIFDWINFFILIFLACYGYRRFLYQSVKNQMASQEKNLLSLRAEASGLESRVKEVVVDLELQKQKSVDLLKKVQLWRQAHTVLEKSLAAEIKKNQIKIDHKNQMKIQNLSLSMYETNLLSQVVARADVQLRQKFAVQKNSNSYLDRVCDTLRKG